jgi:fatty-acyl-CoA synthase
MSTLIDLLERAQDKEHTGFIFVDRKEKETEYNFRDVYTRTQIAAANLQLLGIKKGDCVALFLPTSIEFMDAFLGAQYIGAIPVPLYPPMRLGKLDEYFARTASMLDAVQASIIITNPQIKRILGQLVAQYNPPKGVLLARDLQKECSSIPNHQTNLDDICLVQFSSGTTQNPKPVTLTHRQTLANVQAIEQSFPPNISIPVGCSWLPLYHDMGLIGCVFPAISFPGRLVLIPPEVFLTKPKLWLRAISRHQAFISPAPNFAYSLCTQRIKDSDLEDVDLSCWKMALNGAEPVAPAHLRSFIERFAPFGFRPEALTPVYGLAEASLAVTFSDPNKLFTAHRFDREKLAEGIVKISEHKQSIELASVGTALDGFTIEIRNEQGTPLPSGSIGSIWVQGPSLTSGYLGDIPSPIIDGWLNTGDVGFLFENELYISGRIKDVLVIRGQNHSPYDIEHAVDSVDGVRTGCAVAVSNITEQGEQLLVFVEYRTHHPNLAQSCQAAIIEQTGIRPDAVIVLESGTLPRTSSGKLRRRETLQRYLLKELIPPKKVNTFLIAGALTKSVLGYLKSRR